MKTIIYIDNQLWYITKIDGTHIRMSVNKKEDPFGIYHIEQLSHTPYYNDIKMWLCSGSTIESNRYYYDQ